MQGKIYLLSLSRARSKTRYVADSTHRRHRDVNLVKVFFGGVGTESQLMSRVATVGRNTKIRRGPPQKAYAVELELSLPPNCDLYEGEKSYVLQRLRKLLLLSAGMLVWHTQKKKQKIDAHLITLNRDRVGNPLTERGKGNLLFRYRAILDSITADINRARSKKGLPRIPEMHEIKEGLLRHREELIAQMAN